MVIKAGRFGRSWRAPHIRIARPLAASSKARAKRMQPDEPLDEKCTLCGNGLVKKHGRFGEFIGCSGYPEVQIHAPHHHGHQVPQVR